MLHHANCGTMRPLLRLFFLTLNPKPHNQPHNLPITQTHNHPIATFQSHTHTITQTDCYALSVVFVEELAHHVVAKAPGVKGGWLLNELGIPKYFRTFVHVLMWVCPVLVRTRGHGVIAHVPVHMRPCPFAHARRMRACSFVHAHACGRVHMSARWETPAVFLVFRRRRRAQLSTIADRY
jgi:hypothetical protein